MKTVKILWIAGILAVLAGLPVYAEEGRPEDSNREAATARQFGSLHDADANGYWSSTIPLTWTWYGEYDGDRFCDGESVVIGNGPKYSDLYPEITDREYLLKEYVNYPGEGMTNLNSWGEPKANYDDETLQELKAFVNSFDWIHSDELTRMKAVHDRIAVGRHGNRYGSFGATRTYNGWSVLLDGEGICMDYAGEFQRLAQYVGLECVTYSPYRDHLTCMVKVNGQWITTDPSVSNPFFDNTMTLPVDFDVEYHRYENEYKQSDTGKRMEELRELNRQLEQDEISYEEFERKANEIWN